MEGIQAVRKIPHGHGQHQMGDLLQSIRRGHHAGGIDGLHIPVREGVGRQHLVIEGLHPLDEHTVGPRNGGVL